LRISTLNGTANTPQSEDRVKRHGTPGVSPPVEGLRTGADPVAMPGCIVND